MILGLMLVPAVPMGLAASPDCGIEIDPSMTKVGFLTAFSVDVNIVNPTARALDMAMVNVTFDKDLVEVISIATGGAVSSPFTIEWANEYDNAVGYLHVDMATPSGTWTWDTNPIVCTVNMKSKSASGLTTLGFAALDAASDPATCVIGNATDHLDPALVANGTVKAGKAVLAIAVSDSTTLDVTFPNATDSERYQTLVAADYPNNTATALVQFCPPADRYALSINLSLLYAYAVVNMTTGELLTQVAYMLSDLDDPGGNMTMGDPVTRTYAYDAGHGMYGYVDHWTYNVTMIIPGMAPYPLISTAQRWVNVTSYSDPVAVSSCGVPLGDVLCFHAVHWDAGYGVGNITNEEWIANPGIPGALNGTGTVQMKDYFYREYAYPTTPACETTVLAGVHPAAVSGSNFSAVAINGAPVAPPYPDVSLWDWDEVKTLSAVTYIPGWYFSHWTGDLYCAGNDIQMDTDKTVFPNYCQAPPVLYCADPSLDPFQCRAGDPDPVNQTIDIENAGGYTDVWSVSATSDTGWLSVAPPGGALDAGVHATINVHANCTGSAGTYTGWVNITGNTDYNISATLVVSTAETIDVCRDLPGNALLANQTYPGQTFTVTVNWTAPQDQFNSIGLTDVAPDGWMVETDNSWCTPAADFNLSYGNKVEYMWAENYPKDTAFLAVYNVTVPETAVPGLNVWEVCPNMSESWLEYYYDWNGSYSSCIGCEFEMVITLPGYVTGETRDVNADLLPDTLVTLKRSSSDVNSDESTPNYEMICWNTGSDYWLLATKDRYDDLSSVVEGGKSPHNLNHTQYIDWSTPELLVNSYHVVNSTNLADFDFEGDYGLVPMACDMSYSLRSVNLWLFWPAEVKHIDMGIITDIDNFGLHVWKAMQSVDSWQNPS